MAKVEKFTPFAWKSTLDGKQTLSHTHITGCHLRFSGCRSAVHKSPKLPTLVRASLASDLTWSFLASQGWHTHTHDSRCRGSRHCGSYARCFCCRTFRKYSTNKHQVIEWWGWNEKKLLWATVGIATSNNCSNSTATANTNTQHTVCVRFETLPP